VGAAVVSGMDAAPIFEPSEHVFDSVALLVEDGVIGDGDLRLDFEGCRRRRRAWRGRRGTNLWLLAAPMAPERQGLATSRPIGKRKLCS
jgi:hypothetical protein